MAEGRPAISGERSGHKRQPPERNYYAALGLWFVPPLIAGAVLIWANLQVHPGVASINYGSVGLGVQFEERPTIGWPSILASQNRASNNWELDTGGFFTDCLCAILAVYISSLMSAHMAQRMHREVTQKFKRRMRRRISAKPN